jgi:hypothetical protein
MGMQQHPAFPDPRQPEQPPLQPDPGPQQVSQQRYAPPPYTPYSPPPYVSPNYSTEATPGAGYPPHPPQAPQASQGQSNRKKLLIGGGIGCGALLVLCMCAGMVSAIAALGSSPSTAQGVQTPGATIQVQTPTTTPQPTATLNPNAGAGDYVAVVTVDATLVVGDLTDVGTVCGNGDDLSGCRAALVTARDDGKSFLADLDAHPAPPCLKAADKPLRAALRDIVSAAQEIIDGIDTISTSKIQDGTALIKKATSEIDTATSELKKASCS